LRAFTDLTSDMSQTTTGHVTTSGAFNEKANVHAPAPSALTSCTLLLAESSQ